ncbi:hypothetical protein ANN_26399 [Periplaneta americana]|uniref:Endonuclease/exonuclease/phosphatase domain-containing protein n=1 Tax=Periplaneta americana TaxID=6978 RepID=A0ABQ8RY43_PERAM|nr:hypothetical protein ANN_26399 [Periplaneta americana]
MIIVKTTTITVIGLYIQPNVPVENVIDLVYKVIEQTRTDKNVILAGDLNCRLDKQNAKTHILLETLEEEGFRLENKKEIPTYIAHNGYSTIDLVFYKGEHLKLTKQEGLWSSKAAPIRKHIPIKTFQMEIPPTEKRSKRTKHIHQKNRAGNNKTEQRQHRESEDTNRRRQTGRSPGSIYGSNKESRENQKKTGANVVRPRMLQGTEENSAGTMHSKNTQKTGRLSHVRSEKKEIQIYN